MKQETWPPRHSIPTPLSLQDVLILSGLNILCSRLKHISAVDYGLKHFLL